MSAEECFADHTEPLVDATGVLILASSKKDIKTLSSACQDIQHHLSQIVRIGADYALAQDEATFQEELAAKVNHVSDRLEKLVPAFAAFLQDNTNSIEKATDYATMAKDLGIAISELIVAADYTGSSKLLALVQVGKKAGQLMERNITPNFNLQGLTGPSRDILINEKNIAATLPAFLRHAASQERKQQVSARTEDLRSHTTKYVTTIQNLLKSNNPVGSNKINELQTMNETLLRRLQRLEDTLKRQIGFGNHLNSLYEQAIRLLKSARELKLSGQRLVELAGQFAADSNEFVAAAAATALAAKKLADAAERTLEDIDDPGRRYQIQQAIRKVLDNSSKLIQDARKLANDPTNHALAKQLEQSYANLDESIQDLLLVADMDENNNLLGKIHFSTKYAHDLANSLDGDPANALRNAEMIQSLTKNVIEDARRHAKTLPPAKRAEVERNCDNLEKLTDHLVAAAARYAATGSDEDRMKLDQVREMFQRGLQAFRKVVGLDGSMDVRPAIHIDLTPPVPESVIKGRQEAEECLEIVNFAREMVAAHPQSENRDKIDRGASLLEKLAGQLKQACDDAEANPFEPEYLEVVEDLRKKVAKSGAAILEHASALHDEELPLADLPPEEKKAIETVNNIDDIIASLDHTLLNLDNLEGEEFLEAARAISAKVKEVCKVLNEFAGKAEGKDKERLKIAAKILSDESIQAKILASVVAAEKSSPGECDTAPGDSFKACARTLVHDLHQSKDTMESTAIRSTASVRKERMQKMLAYLKAKRGF
mmetsp:Transcript_29074/g.44974  ORF Transcript_29074/g.44974 Transcript_29074/m.44974 type:complete len:772 (-) Transcript_29074:74-2389(-)|eukprot:CAMPEP_0201512538 /NCGR_PEP_ID=MMETSP0161_2-20130828/4771_1 /ASSEMBLY_ACC=CAM_ASM_000251 /TAXON_ID=180227 /ORGANISM="Neoparamoeba aestuarina, Strain SoJaBio B1-5/56/2" /LENGTH=771 /DNA_ID=CAMNT_0047908417 /DNA_START=9 /DNA_END=2324 /DNA_ORIENTATION=+